MIDQVLAGLLSKCGLGIAHENIWNAVSLNSLPKAKPNACACLTDTPVNTVINQSDAQTAVLVDSVPEIADAACAATNHGVCDGNPVV